MAFTLGNSFISHPYCSDSPQSIIDCFSDLVGDFIIMLESKTRSLDLVPNILYFYGWLWPSQTYNSQILRQEYIHSLQAYKGVPYVWGDESKRGIDCSGLMRCALIDAEVKRGISTLNPSLVRAGFSLWWNDCSALAMKEEFQHRTRLLFTAVSINQISDAKIKPGDIAVTFNGVHVLAYIGNKTWIEADPNEGVGHQVIEVKTPSHNPWFNMPVHVMRWRMLE